VTATRIITSLLAASTRLDATSTDDAVWSENWISLDWRWLAREYRAQCSPATPTCGWSPSGAHWTRSRRDSALPTRTTREKIISSGRLRRFFNLRPFNDLLYSFQSGPDYCFYELKPCHRVTASQNTLLRPGAAASLINVNVLDMLRRRNEGNLSAAI
jgi:hypothetical protein